ncbi:MAG: 3-dehydroquinate synthase [Cyanobacteriota bacterium]|nr:3-dehydroquinate synthase [Cyanobacteriota bacterium]
MSVIEVKLPQQSYPIQIAAGGLSRLGEWMQPLELGKKVLVVSNPEIFGHYGRKAIAALESVGFEVAHHLIEAGEQYKNLASIQKIYDTALGFRLERSSTMVALGGGVVGDMTGFAAATWLRGMNFVQVPTSLLAMVDASIGGKTGVNHPQGKNLIGAFYQPRFVLIDPDVLQTLPAREFRAGMAEVIKYGIIWDDRLFDRLEKADRTDDLNALDNALLEEILGRSCQAKADVVSKDEKEAGLRAILNYGHTIGHAVESLTGYTTFVHGEAVAIGMVAASRIALELGLWEAECDRRQLALIEKTQLPTQVPTELNADDILTALQSDKKVKGGIVRFVLPQHIGAATVSDRVSADAIRQAIR